GGGLSNQIFHPGCGTGVAQDVEVLVPNHVSKKQRFDLFAGSILLPFLREMAAAVESVRIAPPLVAGSGGRYGFFTVKKCQPHAVALKLFTAKLVSDGEKQSGAGTTVIGACKAGLAQRIVGINVRSQNDDPVFAARKLCDD